MDGLRWLERQLKDAGMASRVYLDVPMAEYTSFRIGGPADVLAVVESLSELTGAVALARRAEVPWRVIGAGTNLLVADAGLRGLVIVNRCRGYRIQEDGLLRAESGAPFSEVAEAASSAGWAGLAWAAGVPGTVGGAVVNNAGAYGGSVAETLRELTWLREDGVVETVPAERMAYAYRTSALKRDEGAGESPVVLEATFGLEPGDAQDLLAQMAHTRSLREARFPAGCCAGSTFKRTMQYPAGFLIEQAGLKGARIGAAEVSAKHANFLMNTGGATAADMRALIELVQRRVWEAFGQRLEPEIQFVGEWETTPVETDAEPGRTGRRG